MKKKPTDKEYDLLEEILSRRENECSPPWPRMKWDYTEWEEAFDEFRSRQNEVQSYK